MRKIIFFLLLVSAKLVVAQSTGKSKTNRDISYGFFGGGIYSSMSNLPDVIVPEGVYEGYTLEGKGKVGGTGGFFINWKYPTTKVAILTETFYSGQGTDLNYDDVNGLKYKMSFDYHYINVGTQLKYYPIEILYIGIGPYVGFNVSGDNIKYSSNAQELFENSGTYFEPDDNVEKVLRESLTGRNYFYGMLCAGFEFKSNLSIGVRYTVGLTDALTTEENGHHFRENKNNVNSISLSIGYSFHFDDLPYFKGRHH